MAIRDLSRQEHLLEVARGAIDEHLADVTVEDGVDAIFDSAYTLAFEALWDEGVGETTAQTIAKQAAMMFAQP